MPPPDPLAGYEPVFTPPQVAGPVAPRTMGEVFTAARTLQEADNSDFLDRVYDEEFGKVLGAVNEARRAEGLRAIMVPSAGLLPGQAAIANNAYAEMANLTGASRREVAQFILREAARIRTARPDFLAGVGTDVDAFLEPRLAKERGKRTAAREVVAGSEGFADALAGFAGGVTRAMEDPTNIATLPIGGMGRTFAMRLATEAAAQGAIELALQPWVRENRAALGEELTAGEAAANVLTAMAGGAFFHTLFEAGAFAARKGIARFDTLDKQLARALEGADIAGVDPRTVLGEVLARQEPGMVSDVLRGLNGDDAPLPDEAEALTVLDREAEIDGANPFAPVGDGRARFEDGLTRGIDAILNGVAERAPATMPDLPARSDGPDFAPPTPPARSIGSEALGFDRVAVKRAIRGPESGGNDAVTNRLGSSASGRYQFTEGTFKSLYRKVYGGDKAAVDAAWRDRRFDVATQELLIDRLLDDNAAALRAAGFEPSTGNLYLAHFAGSGTAVQLLRAPPDAPVSRYFSRDAIVKNPGYLGGGKSVSEAIAAVHRAVGGRAASVPASGRAGGVDAGNGVDRGAVLADEALALQRQAADIPGLGPVQFDNFRPGDVGVDAALMQFKAGGDSFGVTERLQAVETWNPILAGRVVVWEAADGRRLIADGHQRHGLARRISEADPAQDVRLDALVLRENDGWSAETARTWAALKNIAEGSGSAVDAAKVLAEIPREQWVQFLPPKSALVRDAEGLVRLGDDAFGMVVNELVDPAFGAIVGREAADPGEQLALMTLLARLAPATTGEARGVIRQAKAAGFERSTQTDMFGSLDSTASLFMERARVLDRGLAELRKLKSVFGNAARHADTLESAGNRIDRGASAREVSDNATALELVERLAWRAGPIKEAIDDGARRLAGGDKLAGIVRDFVGRVRDLDLTDLEALGRSGDGAGGRGGADGNGRGGDAPEADPALRAFDGDPGEPRLTPQGDATDPIDGAWPSRAEMEEAGQTGFDLGDEAALPEFEQPGGEGASAQAEDIVHDIGAAQADFAAPTREQARRELELKTEGRQKGEAAQKAPGSDGGLFDVREGPPNAALLEPGDRTGDLFAARDATFTVDGEERALGDMLDAHDALRAATKSIRDCLK